MLTNGCPAGFLLQLLLADGVIGGAIRRIWHYFMYHVVLVVAENHLYYRSRQSVLCLRPEVLQRLPGEIK